MANSGYFVCRSGKKRLKNVTQKEFLTPAGTKKVKFQRGAASYKIMMTNVRVFPRVKVLLAVLQLPTTIAKRKKGNSFRSG